MHTSGEELSVILGPIQEAEFFNDYWEQAPLHVSRADPGHFSSLLSLQKIETLLSSQTLYFPSVQLVRLHDPVATSTYTDDARRIIPHRLLEYHRNGATIVLSQAHERIASLADFRRSVQAALQLRCQTNVYLSPPGKQGFNAHYDSHDVFILQVAGSKTFNFYGGGIELPYSHDAFDAARHVCGELQESILLEAGDTLYIPRGVMHDAVASEASSLHITLGVYALTWRDVMLEMVQQLTQQDARYRQSVPGSWLRQQESIDSSAILSQAEELSPVFSSLDLQRALSSLADTAAIDSAADCRGLLTGLLSDSIIPEQGITPTGSAASGLCLSASIKVKPSRLISKERSGTTLRCRTHGQVLEFSDPSASAVEWLLGVEQCVVSILPGLDDEQKLAVCQRLLYANILEIVESDIDEASCGESVPP